MTMLSFRRPDTALVRACPIYKAALDAVDIAIARGDEKAAMKAWAHASEIAAAFRQGVEFGKTHERERYP